MILNKSTIPIFMALLAIKIVANNFFGRSKSLAIMSPLDVFFSAISFTSVPERPKKATSAPEINAEHMSNIKRIHALSANAPSSAIKLKTKLRGSGSNSYCFGFTRTVGHLLVAVLKVKLFLEPCSLPLQPGYFGFGAWHHLLGSPYFPFWSREM